MNDINVFVANQLPQFPETFRNVLVLLELEEFDEYKMSGSILRSYGGL
jgi:hypothetical protein